MSDTPAEFEQIFDQSTLLCMRRTLKERLAAPCGHEMLAEEYRRMLAAVDAELEVRARRRDAEFAGAVARAKKFSDERRASLRAAWARRKAYCPESP